MPPAVAIATCAEHAELDDEGRLLLGALRERGIRAEPEVWTQEPACGWHGYDLVVLRSTWDYTFMAQRFLAWTRQVGARLLNAPDVVAWNVDKRYLFELAREGIATITTEHVAPGAPFAPPPGHFVVKPAVAAGSRGAAVFDEQRHGAAREHLAALHAAGHEVLVQPYLHAVDGAEAETALVFLDGALSHAMRKGPLLALDLPPPEGLYREEDMRRVEPAADVVALGLRVHELVERRFGRLPYARVDVLRDDTGAPAVLELELIEPSLFFARNPAAAARYVAGLTRRLSRA